MTLRIVSLSILFVVGFSMLLTETALALAFTEGNLAIYRNAPQSPGNAPAAVFIDEYTPAGALVQSIPMPTTTIGSQRAFTAQANASLEGLLNRSTDGRYLVLTGYAHNLGDSVPSGPGNGTLAQTTADQVNRVIGRVDFEGNVDTSTWYNDSGQGSPRSVISDDGSNFWISQGSISMGSDGGVRFTTFGTTGASTSISQDSTDIRHIDIFGGQLYVTSFTTNGLMSVDVNTGTMTGLENIATTDRVQFYMADLSTEIAGIDTAYVADMRAVNEDSGGGLYKFALDAEGIWRASGSIAGTQPDGEPAVHALRGLTGTVDELGTVTIFATRNASGNGRLLKFVDNTGYAGMLSGSADEIATVSGAIFKGIDFAPVASTTRPGDHNNDGIVDAADYVAWRKLDGANQQGYDDFVENFGSGVGGGQATGVPEPAVISLFMASLLNLSGFARRRRVVYASAMALRKT